MAQTQGQPGPEKDGEGGQPGRVGVGWLKSIYGNKKLSLRVRIPSFCWALPRWWWLAF